MIVSITEAARLAGVSRTTVYEKINGGELSRTPDGIDTSELIRVFGELRRKESAPVAEPAAQPASDDNISRLLDRLESKDDKIERLEIDLSDVQQRLEEHRKAAKALISPDDFEAKILAERERLEQEKIEALALKQKQHDNALTTEREQQAKLLAKQKHREAQQVEKWEQAITKRQLEIQQAREEASAMKEREQKQAEALKLERKRLAALESRGLIGRLLNRKPVIVD